MSEVYPVPPETAAAAHIDDAKYKELYERSVADPEGFWREQAKRLDWAKFPTKIKNVDFTGDVKVRWYEDGELNVCYNCVDRHLDKRAEQTAFIFEGDDPGTSAHITYRQLHDKVCRLANVLKNDLGVKKGDRVMIYMPMVPEACYAMLACARLGAVHSVIFGGFSPEAISGRIQDAGAKVIITADGGLRGSKSVPLKKNVDEAIEKIGGGVKALMFRHTGVEVDFDASRDFEANALMDAASPECAAEPMNAEDPLFILYTSGSTGQPKGVLHTSGGYLVYAGLTHEMVFDYKEGDVYWCTADVGWITGHSYIVYGPLANGATSLVFEGVPTYPDASRFWQVVDKHKVNIFYTAPTAIRALMRSGDEVVKKTSRASLRLLGTVGEPINPEAWRWYHEVVGEGRCPIVDTWWQTETGGIMISPIPGAVETKPGSATKPFPGIHANIFDEEGVAPKGEAGGFLVVTHPWPGMLRGIWGDKKRFKETYWGKYDRTYFAGDGAHRDKSGYFWIIGRIDDVMNISGHRIGTMEVESALVSSPDVAEAAVVGRPDEITGTAIVAFVSPKATTSADEALVARLKQHV